MSIKNVMDTALLGVSKKNLQKQDLPTDIANMLNVQADEPELSFLQAACMSYYYYEAAKIPSKLEFTPQDFIIEEEKEAISDQLLQAFILIDKSDTKLKEAFLDLWLDKVIANNQIADADILLKLLAVGNTFSVNTKSKILQVIGNTGKWILTLDNYFNYNIKHQNLQQLWEEGSTEERIQVLKKTLAADVAQAVAMLQATWAQASIHEKYNFINALKGKYTAEVFSFVKDKYENEFCYKPKEKQKEKQCRKALAMYLLAFPQSDLQQKTCSTLQQYFKQQSSTKLLGLLKSKAKISYALPQNENAQFWNTVLMEQMFGFETTKYDAAYFNDIFQYWLSEFLANIPAQTWINGTEISTENFVTCLVDAPAFNMKIQGKDYPVFLSAIVQNVQQFPNEGLNLLLLDKFEIREHPELLKSLSKENFEKFVSKHDYFTDGYLLPHRTKEINETWSLAFSEQLIQKNYEQYLAIRHYAWQLGAEVAMHIHPSADAHLQRLHAKAQHTDFFTQWNNHFYSPINEAIQLKKLLNIKN
ncbi:MAG: DUF5691 domain-containing protein [Chitinophagales bacterium]|nr:hypothetical protein [Bacteroidota bacterium]MCB9043447.1 hypothetical protein [Chitinophagales bacterium]